jgi:hypothetical protein
MIITLIVGFECTRGNAGGGTGGKGKGDKREIRGY